MKRMLVFLVSGIRRFGDMHRKTVTEADHSGSMSYRKGNCWHNNQKSSNHFASLEEDRGGNSC